MGASAPFTRKDIMPGRDIDRTLRDMLTYYHEADVRRAMQPRVLRREDLENITNSSAQVSEALTEQAIYDTLVDSSSSQWQRAQLVNDYYTWYADSNSEEQRDKRLRKEYKTERRPVTSQCIEFDKWVFYDKKHKLITDMSLEEIDSAISDLKIGYGCYGQKNKIVTLERIGKEKRDERNKSLPVLRVQKSGRKKKST